ncbi:MAG: zinc metallopeptidase [Kiritimatiellia bacterium]
MFAFLLDPLYLMMLVPGMIVAGLATLKTKTTFARYSRVRASSGITGAEAARRMMDREGLRDIPIEQTRGFLSDHYDPAGRKLRLSPKVYGSDSLAAIGVACHEAGHALQHSARYLPLGLRSVLVPAAQVGSNGAYIIFMLGLFMGSAGMMKAGVILFSAVVLFSIITLPVEWNATQRAKRLMVSSGIVSYDEQNKAGAVLNAAFLTYVASAFTAILTLLYFMLRAGLLGGGDD